MICAAKHTEYQPTIDDWKCPECGAGDGKFCIDDGPNMECEDLHEADEICCYACRYETTGKAFAVRLQKARNLVPCPHCRGKGLIPGSDAEGGRT